MSISFPPEALLGGHRPTLAHVVRVALEITQCRNDGYGALKA